MFNSYKGIFCLIIFTFKFEFESCLISLIFEIDTDELLNESNDVWEFADISNLLSVFLILSLSLVLLSEIFFILSFNRKHKSVVLVIGIIILSLLFLKISPLNILNFGK